MPKVDNVNKSHLINKISFLLFNKMIDNNLIDLNDLEYIKSGKNEYILIGKKTLQFLESQGYSFRILLKMTNDNMLVSSIEHKCLYFLQNTDKKILSRLHLSITDMNSYI